MTPYQLEILMHYYTSPSKFPRHDAPVYEDEVEYWVDQGVLERVNSITTIRVTKLGNIFIEWLLSRKVPTMKTVYIDENGNEIRH